MKALVKAQPAWQRRIPGRAVPQPVTAGLHDTPAEQFALAEKPCEPQIHADRSKNVSNDPSKKRAPRRTETERKQGSQLPQPQSSRGLHITRIPQTSVIVPFFNSKDYIPSCLDALRGQTFNDFEVIFVNDGSSDEGPEILKKSIAYDKKFRILNVDTNSGPAVARNLGIQAAKGRYVRFMDIDDSLPPDSLAALLRHCRNQDFVRGSTEVVSQGKTHLDQACDKSLIDLHPFIIPMPTRSKLIYGHCSMLLARKFLVDNDIWFPEQKKNAEDTTFLTDCFFTAERVTVICDVVYRYMRHPGSLSNPSEPELTYFLNTLGRWLYVKERARKSGQPSILDEAFSNALKNYISKEHFPRIKDNLDAQDTRELKEALENVLRAYQTPIEPYLHFFERESSD